MLISRRGLLTGLASLMAAPAIVRASSLMSVKAWNRRFGASSLLLDGSSDYLAWEGEEFTLDGNAWTIEFALPNPHIVVANGRVFMDGFLMPPQAPHGRL